MPYQIESRIIGTKVLEKKNIVTDLKLRKSYLLLFSLNWDKMFITQFLWQNTAIQLVQHQPRWAEFENHYYK